MSSGIQEVIRLFASPGGLKAHDGRPATSRENVHALLDKLQEFTDDELARDQAAQSVVEILHCVRLPVSAVRVVLATD